MATRTHLTPPSQTMPAGTWADRILRLNQGSGLKLVARSQPAAETRSTRPCGARKQPALNAPTSRCPADSAPVERPRWIDPPRFPSVWRWQRRCQAQHPGPGNFRSLCGRVIAIPVQIVAGTADDNVPVASSARYLRRTSAAPSSCCPMAAYGTMIFSATCTAVGRQSPPSVH